MHFVNRIEYAAVQRKIQRRETALKVGKVRVFLFILDSQQNYRKECFQWEGICHETGKCSGHCPCTWQSWFEVRENQPAPNLLMKLKPSRKCPQILLSPVCLPSARPVVQPVLQTQPVPLGAFPLLANTYTTQFITRAKEG